MERDAASDEGIWNLVGIDGTLFKGTSALITGWITGPSNVFAGHVLVRPTSMLLIVKGFATPFP
jgi:hypothetical protein